jgi:hypothetical protein
MPGSGMTLILARFLGRPLALIVVALVDWRTASNGAMRIPGADAGKYSIFCEISTAGSTPSCGKLTQTAPECGCTKKAPEKSAFANVEKYSFFDSPRSYENKTVFQYML